MVAKMYSSGERVRIRSWVSKIMNIENSRAPPIPMSNSRPELCTKS